MLLIPIFSFFLSDILQAQTKQGKINVTVTGLRNQDGVVRQFCSMQQMVFREIPKKPLKH